MATTPLIEVADTIQGGSNGTGTPKTVNHLAYEVGDFVGFCFGSDGTFTITIPDGPNGETAVVVQQDQAGSPNVSFWYYIGTGSVAAGSISIAMSTGDQASWCHFRSPAGEFRAATPIDSSGIDDNSPTNQQAWSAAFTATAGAADGRVLTFNIVDVDPIIGTPTGWTDLRTQDNGATASVFSSRDTAASASESVAAAFWTIANDSTAAVTFILNAPADAGATPKGPLGLPLHGPGGGPIG